MCPKPSSCSNNCMTIHSIASSPRSPATVSPSPDKDMITPIAASTPSLQEEQIQRQVRRHTNRRVRFSNAQVVGTVIDRSFIPIEDHRNIWYCAHELDSFKTEIRNACQKLKLRKNENENNRRLASGNTAAANSEASTIYNNNNEFESFPTRGLEQRLCKNRQRNKALAIWGTLKAQQRNNDPEFIAMVARKCSYTAVQLAYMEAAKDYCEIYNPEAIPSLSAQIELFASHSFPIKLKRKAPSSPDNSSATSVATNSNSTNGRNVRIRII
jgi:hypothetical protein